MTKGYHFGGWFFGAVAIGSVMLATPAFSEKNIEEILTAKKAEKAETEQKAKELKQEVSGLQDKLVLTSGQIQNLEKQLNSGDARIKDLREKKRITYKNLYKNQSNASGLVTAAHRFKSTTTPQMLVQSTPIDAARASLVMKTLIPELSKKSGELRHEISALDKIEADINDQLSQQEDELGQIKTKKKELNALIEERNRSYAQTEETRKKQEEEVANLAKQAKTLRELVKKMAEQEALRKKQADQASDAKETKVSASKFKLPSNTLLPVQGKIRTGFGETDAMGAKSEGVTFSTRPEAAVIIPLAGKVKFAGPFQKYKQILIVEHEGGYHSLIAGLGRIDTVVGATLSAGEPVGSAENAPNPEIYYELRHQGDPVNPQKLAVAQRKQEKS